MALDLSATKTQTRSDEAWRPVLGYEDWYSVSNLGRVRREAASSSTVGGNNTWPGKVLKPLKTSSGYLRVGLRKGTPLQMKKIHHLVLEAFNGPRPHGHEANHKNGCKTDNRLENLEWSTRLDNVAHAIRTGLFPTGNRHGTRTRPRDGHPFSQGESNLNAVLTLPSIAAIRRLARSGTTQKELASVYGVGKSAIQKVLSGKTWAWAS